MEMLQSGIVHLGIAQRQRSAEPFEVFEPNARHRGEAQLQRFEISQPGEVFQPGVSDLGSREFQQFEV